MSETEVPKAPPAPGCPLPLDVLSANFRKHVDPAAPVPLRMMGAKGLVPMGPKEMATALYMLTFDPDEGVRKTAADQVGKLPDKILSVALRDESLEPQVLGFYAQALSLKPEYLEMLALNPQSSDETVELICGFANERLTEIISQNQLRLLRHPGIVRALVDNPNAKPVTVDSVCDFCVRSGLILDDLQAFKDARRRIFGGAEEDEQKAAEAAAQAALDEQQAESELSTLGAEREGHEHEVPLEETEDNPEQKTRRLTIQQQIMKLSVSKKIEWANKKGNKEVRTLLLRDPNKLVQMAVVQSPRITEQEIAKLSLSRTLPREVLTYIYSNRQLTKNYTIKVNLVNNPKVPVAVAMRFLALLRSSELKSVSKNRNVPNALQTAARNLLDKKNV